MIIFFKKHAYIKIQWLISKETLVFVKGIVIVKRSSVSGPLSNTALEYFSGDCDLWMVNFMSQQSCVCTFHLSLSKWFFKLYQVLAFTVSDGKVNFAMSRSALYTIFTMEEQCGLIVMFSPLLCFLLFCKYFQVFYLTSEQGAFKPINYQDSVLVITVFCYDNV